jgi:hypothetical protein
LQELILAEAASSTLLLEQVQSGWGLVLTTSTTLRSTPGALAFAQDMFLNVPLIADWEAIACTHEHHVNENLQHANRKQRQFD